MNLGTNMAFFNIDDVEKLSLKRIEVCQGRNRPYDENVLSILENIKRANTIKIPVSVHLPIFIPKDYPWDFLDAYYLDDDMTKVDYAFEILEDNLKRLAIYDIDYYVLHFTGIYLKCEEDNAFKVKLLERCSRLNNLAMKYKIRIYAEYFGSNINFYNVGDWIEVFNTFENLGILLDITHYYFSSKWRGFDFEENLKLLASAAKAFHIWTTFGEGVYQESEGYLKYHHIVPNLEQRKADGWAFDTKEILDLILLTSKPVIIEASPLYGGGTYYLESILGIRKYVK